MTKKQMNKAQMKNTKGGVLVINTNVASVHGDEGKPKKNSPSSKASYTEGFGCDGRNSAAAPIGQANSQSQGALR